jgi:hypothetical protein
MQVTSVGLSLFNYQDDARSDKHKIHVQLFRPISQCRRWQALINLEVEPAASIFRANLHYVLPQNFGTSLRSHTISEPIINFVMYWTVSVETVQLETCVTKSVKETGYEDMQRINLAQDRCKIRAVVITVMNLRVL